MTGRMVGAWWVAALAAGAAAGCAGQAARREPGPVAVATAAEAPPAEAPHTVSPGAAASPSGAPAPEPAGPEPGPSPPDVPFTLRGEGDRAIEVIPPLAGGGRWPLVVALHATCMQPGPVCQAFGHAGRSVGWLVCPAGNSACYGEPDWSGPGPTKAAFLAQALARVDERIAPFGSDRPGVLVGWSRGAYAARDIVAAMVAGRAPDGLSRRFGGLVLLAASVTLDPGHLRAVGIGRVVLAAGDHDGARRAMEAHSAALRRAGVESRYVSLGKIGHRWPVDFEERMSEPIAWAATPPTPPFAGSGGEEK